jgi:hypothetical protein
VTTTGTQAISGKTSITSTGAVTGSTLVSNVATGTAPLTVTSTTNVANLNATYVSGYGTSVSGTAATSLPVRDGNANVFAKNFTPSVETTATAAGTTTLTISNSGTQVFTGTSTQTVLLPTTTVAIGWRYTIVNQSTGAVTVQSSGGNTIATVPGGQTSEFTAVVATPTTAAGWLETASVSGTQTLTNKTLTNPKIETLKDSNNASWAVTVPGSLTYISPNQNAALQVGSVTSAVNFVRISGTATGGSPSVLASGTDTDVSLNLISKGAGTVQANGVQVTDISSAQSLSNKTLSSPTLTTPVLNGTATGTGVATAATASTLAQRDSNAILTANGFVGSSRSTVTAAGTTTLTVADAPVQIFTGTSTQTVVFPTTGVVAGQSYTIINQSTGVIACQSSAGNSLPEGVGTSGGILTYTARISTPTAAADWICSAVKGSSISYTPYVAVIRSNDGVAFATGFNSGVTSTATSGGTLTVTNGTGENLLFTGTTTHTCQLPTSSVNGGRRFTVLNNSTGAITVNASGGTTIATVAAGAAGTFVALQSSPTTNAHWFKVS